MVPPSRYITTVSISVAVTGSLSITFSALTGAAFAAPASAIAPTTSPRIPRILFPPNFRAPILTACRAEEQGPSRYALLLQFQHRRAFLVARQQFGMDAVGRIEADLARLEIVDDALAVRGGGFQRAGVAIGHHHIFVVEMHGRGLSRQPGVAPCHHPVIVQSLDHA